MSVSGSIDRISGSCLAFDDDESNVVGSARSLRKLRQRRLDAIAYARGGGFDVARHDFVQTRRAKLFTRWTDSLRHPIRIDTEHISMLHLRPAFSILRVRLDPERQASGRKLFDSPRRMDDQWWIVSGIQK